MWKGNGNTTILVFRLKGLEILHQERRGQVNTVIEHLNRILFYKSRCVTKQHTYQSITYGNVNIVYDFKLKILL